MWFSEEGVEYYHAIARKCREALALLLHLPNAKGISLMPNASLGLNIAFKLLSLKHGATILTSDQEHPVVSDLLCKSAAMGATVVEVSELDAEKFTRKVNTLVASTKVDLIILSHVSYKDGRILPIADVSGIARKAGIPFIVDGAQSIGHIPVNLMELDVTAYAFSGHKWL